MFDGKALAADVADVVKSYVDRQFGVVLKRLDAIESRLDELPAPEPGKPGVDGRDGKDADMENVLDRVAELFASFEGTAMSSLHDEMRSAVNETVSKIEIPIPANGKDGENGKDGVGFTQPIINRSGELVIPTTNGDVYNVGRVVGKQGIPGPAGKDADIEDARKLIRIELEGQLIDVKKDLAAMRDRVTAEMPILVSKSVDERFAQVPPPKNGEDGKDGKDADIDEIRGIIKLEVSSEVQAVVAALPPADPGPPGEPGKDADPEIIATMVREQVSAVVAAFEPEKGKDGADGRDGKDVDMGVVLARMDEQIAQKFAAIEIPRGDAGPPGERGEPGQPGADGKDADMDAAFARIDEQITEKVAAIEVQKGDPGEPGKPGAPGMPGKDADMDIAFARIDEGLEKAVAAFPRPADGHTPTAEEMATIVEKAVTERLAAIKSVGSTMITRSGELAVTYTDGSTQVIGQVCGQDGKSIDVAQIIEMIRAEVANNRPKNGIDGKDGRDGIDGKDGRDGFSLEDFSAEFDGERTITLKFARGDISKKWFFRFPNTIYRGVYKEGNAYEIGDEVSWAGSMWIAMKDQPGHPRDHENSGWKLAVKAGRDGKDGEQGKKGDPGRPGRDLVMLGQGGPNDPKI